MGMVMQEPTLFNYSITENILYGKMNASNSEIREAASVANSLDFIESHNLLDKFEDSCEGLFTQLERNAARIIKESTPGEYRTMREKLHKLVKEERKKGHF